MEVLSITPAKDKPKQGADATVEAAKDTPVEETKKRGRPSKTVEPQDDGLIEVFISSSGKETVLKPYGGKDKPHIYGAVNGAKFYVPCNVPTKVTPEVYGAIEGLLAYEQGHRHVNPDETV